MAPRAPGESGRKREPQRDGDGDRRDRRHGTDGKRDEQNHQRRRRERDSRSRSPPRRSDGGNQKARVRSPPRGPRTDKRARSPDRKPAVSIDGASKPRDPTNDDDDQNTETALMRQMMGFVAFRSTKDTKVPGNDKNYAVSKAKKSEYRQYMNRVGGFNRPLSPTRI